MGIKPESDIIIAGAGAAGLSLAWYLARDFPDFTVNLVDENFTPSSDRTWCYWDNNAVLDPEIIKKSWKKLSLIGYDWEITGSLQDHQYLCTGSEHYHRVLMNKIDSAPGIFYSEGKISELVATVDNVSMNTPLGMISAKWAYQSVKRPDFGQMVSQSKTGVLQHFLGWEIQTNNEIFDPETAILMDYRCSQKHGLGFIYILPFSKTEALIEFTLFTPQLVSSDVYKTAISAYLKEIWGISETKDFGILRTESGIIPMISGYWQPGSHPRLVNIGMAAGLPKASTGYAFSRIQSDIRRICSLMAKNKFDLAWIRPDSTPYRYRQYDQMILHLMRYEPGKIPNIFHTLFHRNGFDMMLRFLDEKTSFSEDLRIISTVPSWSDFARTIPKILID